MALILEQAGHTYGAGTSFAVQALAPVDLEVARGQLVVVLGPTGSGKSTLLRLAAGLIPATCGRVTLEGTPVTGPAAGMEGGVGFVFQAPETQLFAETVLEDVAFGPSNQGLDATAAHARATEALEGVGLDAARFGPRSPFALSGGEARRVALAGVLAMRPAYLLLDEPTAGLDRRGREAVLASIEGARIDTGVIVVTHDAEEFLGRADTVLLLEGGSPVFRGSTKALIEDPGVFSSTGLRPPGVLEVLMSARQAGLALPRLTLDPGEAADLIAQSLRGSGRL